MQFHEGGFHLHLLVFPSVYQLYSRVEALVNSSFAKTSSEGFRHPFKICLMWLLHKEECSFYTYLFCCTEMRWMFISLTAIWVTGSDTGSVASRARSKLTSTKCEWTRIWTIYNVDETTPRVLKFFHFICTNWWQQTHAGLGTLTGYTFIWDWDLNLGCKELRI